MAIFRFLGKKFGFYGKDDIENAIIDSTADVAKDTWIRGKSYFAVRAGFTSGDLNELAKEYFWPSINTAFPYIKKVLDKSGGGFVVPSGLTWVDLWVSQLIVVYRGLEPEFSKKYPWTTEYVDRVYGDPRIKDYVQSRKDYKISYVNQPVEDKSLLKHFGL